jgi:hypothetical protein
VVRDLRVTPKLDKTKQLFVGEAVVDYSVVEWCIALVILRVQISSVLVMQFHEVDGPNLCGGVQNVLLTIVYDICCSA